MGIGGDGVCVCLLSLLLHDHTLTNAHHTPTPTHTQHHTQYDERLEYDLHEPLQRLAVRANPTLLQRALTTLLSGKQQDAVFATLGGGLGGGPGAPQLAPTRLAYLLGVAHSHLSRARLAPQPDAGDMLPLGSLLAQLQVSKCVGVCGGGVCGVFGVFVGLFVMSTHTHV